ncbi:MAG: hypothetical protein JXR19_05330 [Bacteroidia bacterium]
MKQLRILVILFLFSSLFASAQDEGVLSGNFQSNFSFFIKDTLIGADEKASPQYGKQISSAEAWLFLNYDIKGFHLAARYDLFNNSNLLNPSGAYTGQGLGFWQIQKSIGNLEITAGSFYDQFGSGAIFRAYENRLIGIDYAMQGVRMKYDINDNLTVKAFTGKQKGFQDNRFGTSPQIIKGINAEQSMNFEDGTSLNIGVSGVNRTLDENTMSTLVTEINGLSLEDRFIPTYNVYAANGYFSLNWMDFGFTGEYNWKSKEAIRLDDGKLGLRGGSIAIGSISYSKRRLGKKKQGGLGINVQYRRIENFPFLVTPFANLLNGIVTYQPSLTRQASYRMLARYNAPAQFNGETGYQAELVYSFSRKTNIQLNYSDITNLDGDDLFSEKFVQIEHKLSKKWKGKVGFQSVFYKQSIYEGESTYPDVVTHTPFLEFTYKVDRKNSIRFESQYLRTEQDLGSFYNGILEWNSSPKFTIAISDMINAEPQRQSNQLIPKQILHYPSLFVKYNVKTTSFTAAYVKQVEGVNCTGGICRLEPAFSGLRFTLATQF